MGSDSTGKPVLPLPLRVRDFEPSELDRLAFEYELAELVWGHTVAQRAFPLAEQVSIKSHAARRANGDFVATTCGPDGALRVFVGDMTGRGLAAAIAAQPVVELFHAEAPQQHSAPGLLEIMNASIRDILPEGYFCAGVLLELSADQSHFSLWNCGLPDAWLTAANGEHRCFSSQHPPLGVLRETDLRIADARGTRAEGQRFVVATDGVIKAERLKGGRYGESGFYCSLCEHHAIPTLSEALFNDMMEFCWPKRPEDDATVVVVA